MRLRHLLFALPFLLGLSSVAQAEITITFYSHHLGTYRSDIAFLHAFVALTGTTESDKKPVNANFGFTASDVSPAILWKSVPGEMASMPRDYVAASRRHFSMPISDAQYRAVLSVVARWQHYPQPSYNLDTHNCVTFVKDVALALHLPASNDRKLVHSPQDFLEDLRLRTREQIAAAQARGSKQPLRAPRVSSR